MAIAHVIDELIVKLRLDTSEYDKADAEVEKRVDQTEKQQQGADNKRRQRDKRRQTDARQDEKQDKERDLARKKRELEQQKRNKETERTVKSLTGALRGMALTMGTLLGIGTGAAGIAGAVVAFAGMETGLRRTAVSTGLSNREMQAWGATAKRLGTDADAGAAAIADLAREQKQFALTGQAPTLQTFARMGVRVSPDTPIADVLGQAQQLYRQSTPAQRSQIESGLAAQGVSADLILMIKSEKDARDAYTRSLNEAATENRAALDALSDTMAGLGTAAANLANSIATAVQPYVEQLGQWLSSNSQSLSDFNDKVIAAGGGVDGFMKVLDQESPQLANLLRNVGSGLSFLGQVVDVVVFGLQELGRAASALFKWIDDKLGGIFGTSQPLANVASSVWDFIKQQWTQTVDEARQYGAAPVGTLTGDTGGARLSRQAAARLAGGGTSGGAGASSPGDAQSAMQYLITRYGLSVPQAAAVIANGLGESGLRANAFNAAGGGTGARGAFQWRGDRTHAFQARYGMLPNLAPIEQQLDFMMSDPYERRLLMRSLGSGSSAAELGASFSRIFEAHGNVAEDMRRGRVASQLAANYGNGAGTSSAPGQQININGPVTVQANNPNDFVGGIQRISGVQNYQAGVR
jgi:hypothetical protein